MTTTPETKKYNNDSIHFKDWTTQKIKKIAQSTHSAIYVSQCYGVSDLLILERCFRELMKRGYQITENGLVINKNS
jgi:hypothetical protein